MESKHGICVSLCIRFSRVGTPKLGGVVVLDLEVFSGFHLAFLLSWEAAIRWTRGVID